MAQTWMVNSFFASVAAAMVVAGCQTTTTPAPPTQVTPAAQAAAPKISSNPRADAAAAAAQQQAKAIEELLAARAQSDAQDRGLTIVEPKSNPAASAGQTAPPPTIPKVAPLAPPIQPPPPVAVDSAKPMPEVSFTPANTGIVAQPPATPAPANPQANSRASSPGATENSGLEQQLTRRANEYPRDVAAQLDAQLLAYLKDQPAPDAAALGQLPAEDREIITAVVDGLSNFRNGVRNDNNMLMNRKIRPLVEMADRLKTRADLSINNAQLCTVVRGFGAYTPFDPARLIYGQPPRPLAVYCEVQNFASQYDDKSMWTTKLQMDLVLYTNGGMDVWHQKGLAVNDACRNRRHDFFIAAPITLPAGLAIDQYSLKITISDLNANRVAETTIPVGVVAGQK